MNRGLCAALTLILSACTSSPPVDREAVRRDDKVSEAARQRIALLEAGMPDRTEATHIVKVSYLGKPAYLFIAPCCDHFSYLHDAEGKVLCAPMGGYAGHGDGKCKETIDFGQKPEKAR